MDLPKKDSGSVGTPTFIHVEGYLLSMYKDKPSHGTIRLRSNPLAFAPLAFHPCVDPRVGWMAGSVAKPQRLIDLRELQLLDVGTSALLR